MADIRMTATPPMRVKLLRDATLNVRNHFDDGSVWRRVAFTSMYFDEGAEFLLIKADGVVTNSDTLEIVGAVDVFRWAYPPLYFEQMFAIVGE